MTSLSDHDVEPLAYFWSIFWAATALNPRGCQTYRATMVSLGLVKRRGPLALTPRGKRIMAYCKAPGRPKYPARKQARRS